MKVNTVTSRDGTTIGYRTTGDGPGLVVVHGARQWSLSHAGLAAAVSGEFTVHLPDRAVVVSVHPVPMISAWPGGRGH